MVTSRKQKPAKTGKKQDRENRNSNGTFRKGVSGNPSGRSAGSRNNATIAAQKLLTGEAEVLTRQAIDLALSGNVVALRLCLERIVPPTKELPVSIDLPDNIKDINGLRATEISILKAVASGNLLISEGKEILSMIEKNRVAIEMEKFEQRIATLEKKDEKITR